MNKDFLKTVFHSDVGHVYEYVGSLPEGMEPESPEMSAHVTELFVKGHGDNTVATSVVQFPFQNHRIVLFCNDETNLNRSEDFVLLTDLVPDVVVEETVEETTTEETTETTEETTETTETTTEETTETTQETSGEGQ
jgi:hypothetical protein